MANKKISELATSSTLVGTEEVPIVQSGETLKTTIQDISDFVVYSAGAIPGSSYAKYLAALLEPDAIEAVLKDAFSYTVGLSETKLLLASWQTRLASNGRFEQRNPQFAFPMRNVTLVGTAANSTAIVLNPSKVTYTNPWAVYYDRLASIYELPTRLVTITAVSQIIPFLPGPYGSVITQVTCFNLAWIIGKVHTTYGFNLWDEESDSAPQRIGDSLMLACSKSSIAEIESSSAGTSTNGNPEGSVAFVILPSNWSLVPDPISSSYTFRDDFMSSSLDLGVWTRSQSTSGNVEISTTYQWLKLFGNGVWGSNSIRRNATQSRTEGLTLVCDVYMPRNASVLGVCMIGWNTGAGLNYSDFAHAINFGSGTAPGGLIQVYENGTSRGNVGSGWTPGIYRVKIVLHAGTTASYYIQGGSQYQQIGSNGWTNITPGTTSSASTTVTPGAASFQYNAYISDMRVF